MLSGPLKRSQTQLKNLDLRYLAAVQRRREWPTRFIQAVQALIQRRILENVLRSSIPFTPPLPLRLLFRTPLLRDVPARIIAFGLWPVHTKE